MLHGLGGIGKSTLATQIASRVSRLAPEQVVTMLTGEMSAASLLAEAAEADLVVLDDFGDNLAGRGARRRSATRRWPRCWSAGPGSS